MCDYSDVGPWPRRTVKAGGTLANVAIGLASLAGSLFVFGYLLALASTAMLHTFCILYPHLLIPTEDEWLSLFAHDFTFIGLPQYGQNT